MDLDIPKNMKKVPKSWTAHDFSSAFHDFIFENQLISTVFGNLEKHGPSKAKNHVKKSWPSFREKIVFFRKISTQTKFGNKKWKNNASRK